MIVTKQKVVISYKNKEIDPIAPYDKAYSKVCSYLPDCNFNKILKKKKYEESFNSEPNLDTFTIKDYSDRYIDVIIKHIIDMFQFKSIYTFDTLYETLTIYYTMDRESVSLALDKCVDSDRYPVYNSNYDYGKIIYRGIYYIFQPIYLEDENTDLYYKSVKNISISESVQIPKHISEKQQFNFESSYSQNKIEMTYKNLVKTKDDIYSEYEIFNQFLNITDQLLYRYCLDRLSFIEKHILMYAYLTKYDITSDITDILKENIVYRKDDVIFINNQLDNEDYEIYGFYLVYDHKPVFFRFDENISKMNVYDIETIKESLNTFVRSDKYSQIFDYQNLRGYTTKKYTTNQELTYLKFVKEHSKSKYPPGPGKVAMNQSQGYKLPDLLNFMLNNFKNLSELFDFKIKKNLPEDTYTMHKIGKKQKKTIETIQFIIKDSSNNTFTLDLTELDINPILTSFLKSKKSYAISLNYIF